MKKWVVLTISVLVIVSLVVALVVFRAFGSGDSAVINGCDPFNVEITKGEESNTVLIFWETRDICSAYIVYGEDMKDMSLVAVDTENPVKNREHSVVIKSLLSSKHYYFSIVSEGVNYGKGGLPISFLIDSL